jgi:small subunit ribosomal protein S8
MSIDSIGNFLTVIRNGLMVYKRSVRVPFSKMKFAVANILKEEGFIRDVQKIEEHANKPEMVVYLKYVDGSPVISSITRISKPSRRIYEQAQGITPVIGGMGISILSTNAGVVAHKKAQELSVGGEVICHVW